MMETLIIAFKNIFRNTRRTIITLISIVIGIVALVLFDGYVRYSMWGLRESTIQGGLGHIQISTSNAFFVEGSFDPYSYLIEDSADLKKALENESEVKAVVPELTFSATISTMEKTGVVMIQAIPPEDSVSLFGFRKLVKGRELMSDDKYKVLLGQGVAKKLKAHIGDVLTIMATTRGGGVNAVDVQVVGIVDIGANELNNIMVYMNLSAAKELVFIKDVPLFILMLKNTKDTDAFYRKLYDKIFPSIGKKLYARKWITLAPYYKNAKSLYQSLLNTARWIIILVVIFTIVNTMMMSVFERVREIGTLRAIGAKRKRILSMFMSEGLLIGTIGGILGVLTGLLIAWFINHVLGGLYIPPPPGRSEGYRALITPSFSAIWGNILLAMVVSLFGSIYPSIKAVRLKIADALRYN